ncbi:MAG: hypothetical protein AVDCRST_MAG12-166, partial [uncultured Rubrobacteraceae bacterium]
VRRHGCGVDSLRRTAGLGEEHVLPREVRRYPRARQQGPVPQQQEPEQEAAAARGGSTSVREAGRRGQHQPGPRGPAPARRARPRVRCQGRRVPLRVRGARVPGAQRPPRGQGARPRRCHLRDGEEARAPLPRGRLRRAPPRPIGRPGLRGAGPL